MVRNLTDPDGDDTLEWQERVVDVDGDSVSIDLILDQVDGSNASDSNPSWLGYTPTTNTINTDETEVLVDVTADTSGLSAGSTYTFEITADDGITTTTRTFSLEVKETPQVGGSVGDPMFVLEDFNEEVEEYELTTEYDTTKASLTDENGIPTGASRFRWNGDGSVLIVMERGTTDFHYYGAGTKYDASTLSKNSTKAGPTNIGDPVCFEFSRSGDKLFAGDDADTEINQWTLGTAYDVSTASHDKAITDSTAINLPRGITLKDNGSRLFVINRGGNIFQTDLSTAFDIGSNNGWSSSVSTGVSGRTFGLEFNADGSKFFVCDPQNENVVEIAVSTAWDITSGLTINNTFSLPSNTDPTSVIFR